MKVMRGADFRGSPREPDDLGMMAVFPKKNMGTTGFFSRISCGKLGCRFVHLLLEQLFLKQKKRCNSVFSPQWWAIPKNNGGNTNLNHQLLSEIPEVREATCLNGCFRE